MIGISLSDESPVSPVGSTRRVSEGRTCLPTCSSSCPPAGRDSLILLFLPQQRRAFLILNCFSAGKKSPGRGKWTRAQEHQQWNEMPDPQTFEEQDNGIERMMASERKIPVQRIVQPISDSLSVSGSKVPAKRITDCEDERAFRDKKSSIHSIHVKGPSKEVPDDCRASG